MAKKEIWIEGSFASEVKVDDRPADISTGEEPDGDVWAGDEPGGDGWPDWAGPCAGCPLERDEGEDCGDEVECWVPDDGWPYGPPCEGPAEPADWDADEPGRKGRVRDGKHNKELGRRGEDAAVRYLERRGFRIIDRNMACPFGEADIVARDGDALVFVEVKTRTGISKGFPSEAVDARKRSRYEKIAAWFLGRYDEVDIPVRFDVIAIMVVAPHRAFLRHYANAFGQEL